VSGVEDLSAATESSGSHASEIATARATIDSFFNLWSDLVYATELTGASLALRLGVSEATVSRYNSRQIFPKEATVNRLCDIREVDPDRRLKLLRLRREAKAAYSRLGRLSVDLADVTTLEAEDDNDDDDEAVLAELSGNSTDIDLSTGERTATEVVASNGSTATTPGRHVPATESSPETQPKTDRDEHDQGLRSARLWHYAAAAGALLVLAIAISVVVKLALGFGEDAKGMPTSPITSTTTSTKAVLGIPDSGEHPTATTSNGPQLLKTMRIAQHMVCA